MNTLVSGSPIIQNGKLVGAVTHVLVDDPTTGYGIFIENMLTSALPQKQGKAAFPNGNAAFLAIITFFIYIIISVKY